MEYSNKTTKSVPTDQDDFLQHISRNWEQRARKLQARRWKTLAKAQKNNKETTYATR